MICWREKMSLPEIDRLRDINTEISQAYEAFYTRLLEGETPEAIVYPLLHILSELNRDLATAINETDDLIDRLFYDIESLENDVEWWMDYAWEIDEVE